MSSSVDAEPRKADQLGSLTTSIAAAGRHSQPGKKKALYADKHSRVDDIATPRLLYPSCATMVSLGESTTKYKMVSTCTL